MKQGNLSNLAVLGSVAAMVLSVAPAKAASPKILDEKVEMTLTSGKTTTGTGIIKIKSEKDKGFAKGTSEKAGEFTNTLELTKDALGRTCTGLGDKTAGNVTLSGTYDVRYWGLSEGLKKVAILFLISSGHVSCGTQLVVEGGCVAAQLEAPYNKLTKELQAKLVVSEGDNVPVKVDNATNTAEENCELKITFGEEAMGLASEEGIETLTFKNSLGKAKDEAEVVA